MAHAHRAGGMSSKQCSVTQREKQKVCVVHASMYHQAAAAAAARERGRWMTADCVKGQSSGHDSMTVFTFLPATTVCYRSITMPWSAMDLILRWTDQIVDLQSVWYKLKLTQTDERYLETLLLERSVCAAFQTVKNWHPLWIFQRAHTSWRTVNTDLHVQAKTMCSLWVPQIKR